DATAINHPHDDVLKLFRRLALMDEAMGLPGEFIDSLLDHAPEEIDVGRVIRPPISSTWFLLTHYFQEHRAENGVRLLLTSRIGRVIYELAAIGVLAVSLQREDEELSNQLAQLIFPRKKIAQLRKTLKPGVGKLFHRMGIQRDAVARLGITLQRGISHASWLAEVDRLGCLSLLFSYLFRPLVRD